MNWRPRAQTGLRQLASIVVVFAVWTVVSRFVGKEALPGPAQVAPQFWDLISSGEFAGPLGTSLVRVAMGFAVGFAVGVAYGIAAGRSPRFRYAVKWLFLAFLFEPTLMVIFLGVLIIGPSNFAAVVIVAVMVFPAVGVYIRDVLASFDEELLSVADAFHVGFVRRVRDVYIPYLAPPILTGARIGFSHAWKVVVLVEVFGVTGGMGFMIRNNFRVFNLPLMMAWLLVFILVLLALEQVIRAAEKWAIRWES